MLPSQTLHGLLLARGRHDLIAAIQQRQSRGLVVGHDGSVRQMTVAEAAEWRETMNREAAGAPDEPGMLPSAGQQT